MTGEPALRVVEARKAFGKRPALEGVSFDVAAGRWVFLIGPNGAGKSTLMRALVGLEALDDGYVEILGRRATPRTWPALRRHFGLVPQDVALYPRLTARENLEVFGQLAGLSRKELAERISWALSWTGLADREKHRVRTFSGGMKRRLNIACAVLHEPQILFLDEPTVGVDLEARERISGMLRSLCEEGTCLLQSSHHLEEAQANSDEILVLHGGRLVAAGTVGDLAPGALGRMRSVRLVLDAPPVGVELGGAFRVHGRVVEGEMENVAEDLPRLLARLGAEGHPVRDLRVTPPRLEEVFARITTKGLEP